MLKKAIILLSVLAGAAAGGFQAAAHLPPTEVIAVSCCWAEVPFEQAMDAAEMIVIGKIAGLGKPEWSTPLDASGERDITTPVQLLVEEALEGSALPGELMWFRQFGGQIGRTIVRYSDAVAFVKGERVLLALYRSDGDTGVITHGDLHPGEGKYVIGSDGVVRHSSRPEVTGLEQIKSQVLSAVGK